MRSSQRGWIGLIVILLALVIVALLAKSALQQYGLLPGVAPQGARPAERSAISPAGMAPLDATTAAPTLTAPLERARAVEETLRKQVEEQAGRIEGGQQ